MRGLRGLLGAFLLLPVFLWAAPKNVIIMVPDGTGHASLTVARQLKGEPLALDEAVYGIIQTRSADSSVTDSAAAATAMACGERTYNGAIAVNTDKVPLLTYGEWAKQQGKAVGCVTTDSITGATPASFSSHATHRSQANIIFEQQIASGFDLLLGGGKELLTDERKAFLKQQGYALVSTAEELKSVSGKCVGLFSKGIMTPVVKRRREEACAEPTLPEMASKALDLLAQNPKGFFLLIEGAQVDKGNHANDLPWATYALLEFDETVSLVLRWAKAHPDTVVMIAPDHETGGLTIKREPKEGARAKALGAVKDTGVGKAKDYFVHYSTSGHTGVDVFLAGNAPTLHPVRNCDIPRVLGLEPKPLQELTGQTEEREGSFFLTTKDGGKTFRAQRDAIYIPDTKKWYAR